MRKGSPLSSNAIRNRLLQAPTGSDAHYPQNILEWHNLAAEDDYVCHDKTVANDFSAMLDRRLIGDIREGDAIENLNGTLDAANSAARAIEEGNFPCRSSSSSSSRNCSSSSSSSSSGLPQ